MTAYHYNNKAALIDAIQYTYRRFDEEFNDIEDGARDVRITGVDRTPAEIIAYQLGWLHLVMGWDKQEQEGEIVHMPSPEYKWNQLGALYQSFYEHYSSYSLTELRNQLKDAVQLWVNWIDSYNDEALFIQGVRNWTGDKQNWPMARWIHINSVAPFTNFRTKIRKWKKGFLSMP